MYIRWDGKMVRMGRKKVTGEISRKTFHTRLEAMVNKLREEILTGRYKPGEFLPSERDFAIQYDLSNKSVRKGLDILVAEQLIEKIPRVGNKIVRPADIGKLTLKFGFYENMWRMVDMESLLAEFHKRYPNIRVQAVPIAVANNFSSINRLIDDSELDVVTLTYNGYVEFAEQDNFASFESLSVNPHIYTYLTNAMTYEGELKAQPFVFTPLVLCYNVTHFLENALPEPDSNWRWRDLSEYAGQLSVKHERLGFYTHFTSKHRWPVFLMQNGVVFQRDSQGRLQLRGTETGERLIESMDSYRELINMRKNVQLLSESDADAEKLFFDGKVSMILTTYFSLNYYEPQSTIKYDLAPLPYLEEARTLLLMVGLAIARNSKLKESAKQFIDFLVSFDAQLLIRKKTLSIPSLKTAAEWKVPEMTSHPSRFNLYREIMPTYRLFTTLGLNSREMDVFTREAKLYWTGLVNRETFLLRLESLLSREPKSITRKKR